MAKNIEEKAAIIQNNKRYAIAPHLPGGLITPDQLRKMADVAERFNADAIKLTSSQRIALIGIDEDKIDEAWEAVGEPQGMAIGMCVRSVKFCPGSQYCPFGQQDTITFGMRLDKLFYAKQLPSKAKLGVTGCTLDCAETCIKDIGFIGFKKGWRMVVGGNGGPTPRLSQKLVNNLSDDEAEALALKVVDMFIEDAPKSRMGKWIEKMGFETFKERLGL